MRLTQLAVVALVAFVVGILVAGSQNIVSAKDTPAKGWKGGTRLDDVLESGRFVILDDGTIWEVDSLDQLNTNIWLSTEKIGVVDGERLVVEKKTARATKLKPNDLKPKKGETKGKWIQTVTSGGRLIELNDSSLWEVADSDRTDTTLWLAVDKITITDEIKLTNTSQKPAETVTVTRLK